MANMGSSENRAVDCFKWNDRVSKIEQCLLDKPMFQTLEETQKYDFMPLALKELLYIVEMKTTNNETSEDNIMYCKSSNVRHR